MQDKGTTLKNCIIMPGIEIGEFADYGQLSPACNGLFINKYKIRVKLPVHERKIIFSFYPDNSLLT